MSSLHVHVLFKDINDTILRIKGRRRRRRRRRRRV
jgi:hypothetical protein